MVDVLNELGRGTTPAIGQKCQVFTSENQLDPSFYRVTSYDRQVINLQLLCHSCGGTGRVTGACLSCKGSGLGAKHRVHHTRIARIFGEGDVPVFEAAALGKEKHVATTKPKPVAEVVSLKDLKDEGELYTKQVSFDHDNIKVDANVVITKDHRSFRTFNTYNGSLGKKGRAGKQFTLADEKEYDRKVGQLKKQGYKKK